MYFNLSCHRDVQALHLGPAIWKRGIRAHKKKWRDCTPLPINACGMLRGCRRCRGCCHTRDATCKTADTGVLTMDATVDATLRIGNLRSAKSDKPIVAIGIEGSANKVGWERRSMCAYVLCPPAV